MTLDSFEPDQAEIVALLQPFVDGELSDKERELVAEQIAGRAELGQLETSLIFQHRRSPVLPDYGHEHAAPARGRQG